MKVKLLKPVQYHEVPDFKDVKFPVFTDTFSKVVVDLIRHNANFVILDEQEYPLWYFEYETVINQNLFENYTYEDLNYLFYSINLLSKEIPQGELQLENNIITFKEHSVKLRYDIKRQTWEASWLPFYLQYGKLKEFNRNVIREFKEESKNQYTDTLDLVYEKQPV